MILAFQSQEFGFGYQLTVPDIQIVNEYHDIHHKYVDTDTSTTILGHTHKEHINMRRKNLCQDFEYGTSAKGYFTYDYMVLQLEVYNKLLKDLHPGID